MADQGYLAFPEENNVDLDKDQKTLKPRAFTLNYITVYGYLVSIMRFAFK